MNRMLRRALALAHTVIECVSIDEPGRHRGQAVEGARAAMPGLRQEVRMLRQVAPGAVVARTGPREVHVLPRVQDPARVLPRPRRAGRVGAVGPARVAVHPRFRGLGDVPGGALLRERRGRPGARRVAPAGSICARVHADLEATRGAGRFDGLRRIGNGRVESVNNKIKVTVRMGYGFRNVDNLIALLMLRCSDMKPGLPGRKAA